jgi:hypothetical protein
MRRRWVSWACLAGGLIALGWGASWTFVEWRFQTGLKQAKVDFAARRFDAARRRLAAQLLGRPEAAEAAYLLGACEQALQHPEAAAIADARVPLGSPWGAGAARARAQILINDLGRYAEAQAVLSAALSHASRDPTAA